MLQRDVLANPELDTCIKYVGILHSILYTYSNIPGVTVRFMSLNADNPDSWKWKSE